MLSDVVSSNPLHRHLFSHHSTNHEVLVVALLGNVSYAAAEAFELSPILSVFFAGVTMSHYTWHSLSPEAQVSAPAEPRADCCR